MQGLGGVGGEHTSSGTNVEGVEGSRAVVALMNARWRRTDGLQSSAPGGLARPAELVVLHHGGLDFGAEILRDRPSKRGDKVIISAAKQGRGAA